MTRAERARLMFKALEFYLPPEASKFFMPIAGLTSPYREIEHQFRCIFIHVPKTAGTSIARAMFEDRARNIPIVRYYTFDRSAASSYFKFAFVRNPWSRFYSAYMYLARRVGADPSYPDHRWATHYLGQCEGFNEFVERMARDGGFRRAIRRYIHFRDQADWLTVPGISRLAVDYIGRFEYLDVDFQAICERIGITASLPYERAGEGKDYREQFSPLARRLVADLYRRDIGLFGWTFE